MIKHILKSVSILFVTIVFFASCSKEHKIRNKLSGSWKVVSTTDSLANAELALGITLQYQFGDCKKKDEPCDGIYSISYTLLGFPITVSANYSWEVNDDVLTVTPVDTTLLSTTKLYIDFTDRKKITATDVNNSLAKYNLEKL